MDKNKYNEKRLEMLSTKKFSKISIDPTKKTESKIQTVLRKIKSTLTTEEYHCLYPLGSCPGKFDATTKIHNLKLNDKVDQLPIRRIVPNIGTTYYNIGR